MLLGDGGDLLVDGVGTLVEGVEEVEDVDLAGLEVDLLAADELEELEGGGVGTDASVVAVGGGVNSVGDLGHFVTR